MLEDILIIVIPTGVFLVALAGLVYRVYSGARKERWDNLQEVRKSALPKVARFKEIMFELQHNPERTLEDLEEPARLYSEVRDAYKRFRRGFRKQDRNELDALLDAIESSYDPDDIKTSLTLAMPHMPAFMVGIEAKLNRDA